jgi:hypothetical protein
VFTAIAALLGVDHRGVALPKAPLRVSTFAGKFSPTHPINHGQPQRWAERLVDSDYFEPRFSYDCVGVLRRLQDSLRARTFDLVRSHCLATGRMGVDGRLIERCALDAMRTMVENGRID